MPDAGHLLRNLVRFAGVLRRLGVEVTTPELRSLVRALERIDATRRQDFKDAARAVLVHRHEHLAVFDRAFDLFFSADVLRPRRIDLGRQLRRRPRRPAGPAPAVLPSLRGSAEDDPEPLEPRAAWSAREVLRHKDFADLTRDEERTVRELLRREVLALPPRLSRRREPAPRGPFLDWRSLFRHSLRYGGETLILARRRRRWKRRPLVVLCDISGSMEAYSRLFLQFLYTLGTSTDRLEAFVFATRLTRITRELRSRSLGQALRTATAAVADWGGGTRIGEALRRFNYDWSRRVLGQGAVVAIISDGWDRGDVALLGSEAARLRRRCERLMWLNPLLGSPGYEPLTRGIRAVLAVVDDFLPLHNLESLGQLARILRSGRPGTSTLPRRGPRGASRPGPGECRNPLCGMAGRRSPRAGESPRISGPSPLDSP